MSDLIDPTCRAKRFLSAEQKCEIWSKDPHRGVDHQRGGGATSGGQSPHRRGNNDGARAGPSAAHHRRRDRRGVAVVNRWLAWLS